MGVSDLSNYKRAHCLKEDLDSESQNLAEIKAMLCVSERTAGGHSCRWGLSRSLKHVS